MALAISGDTNDEILAKNNLMDSSLNGIQDAPHNSGKTSMNNSLNMSMELATFLMTPSVQ